jgi:YfiR/HmsC-like
MNHKLEGSSTAQTRGRAFTGTRGRLAMPGLIGLFVAGARIWLVLCLGSLSLAHAEDVAVPLPMQVQLFSSVVDYDKGFAERAKGKVKIVLLTSKNPDSGRAATQVQAALGRLTQIGGQPHEESTVRFESGAALANLCRSNGISAVFLMPGFQSEIADIKHSLEGVNVLSVATIGSYVQQGVVLGFDVISGKPKLLVNLTQARAQKVAFKAELLKMVKVIE